MPTDYGNFHDFCRDSTLPVCNLFEEFKTYTENPETYERIGGYKQGNKGCQLSGIPLSKNRELQNLGVIILCFIAISTSVFLLLRSQWKKAAVGRREMQLFLLGYILIEICEIFTVGGIPLPKDVRIGFTGAHIGLITATTWILMLNGAVGYQLIDDGTFLSTALILISAGCFLIGTGYVALDVGFDWSGYWAVSTVQGPPNRTYGLYTLYFLLPLVFLFVYFVLETIVVFGILKEKKPMIFLLSAVVLFAIGQVFDFVISVHICSGTNGKIDGSLFETLFTLLAVVMIWIFWSSITEDDWPEQTETGTTYS